MFSFNFYNNIISLTKLKNNRKLHEENFWGKVLVLRDKETGAKKGNKKVDENVYEN